MTDRIAEIRACADGVCDCGYHERVLAGLADGDECHGIACIQSRHLLPSAMRSDVRHLLTALDAAQARVRELEAAASEDEIRNATAAYNRGHDFGYRDGMRAGFSAGADAMRRVAVEIAASSSAAALGPRATAHAIGGAPLPEPEGEVG